MADPDEFVAAPLVSFREVTKVYPGPVTALDAVTVDVAPGTIHAFVGENGAGKSTLMKVLSGEVRPDRGEVSLNGTRVRFASPRDAMARGIGIVHQEILLIDELTVWENVVLGVEPITKTRLLDSALGKLSVQSSIERFGLDLDADAVVGDLSVAARQKTEICKLLHRRVGVLILDEPTAVLTPQEIPKFFNELRRLAAKGRTICFVTHHLEEVMELSETVSVLRDGRMVETVATNTTDIAQLTKLMIDREIAAGSHRGGARFANPVLCLEKVRVESVETNRSVGPIDLQVRSGEIVGVAGVEGNGQRELVEVIIGSVPAVAGRIDIAGVDVTDLEILERRRHISFVPAERKSAGGSLDSSVVENTLMTHHRLDRRFSKWRGWFVDWDQSRKFAREVQTRFDVEMKSVSQTLGSLSGGNQQKIVLGRELSTQRSLTILDQPTRGLDVGAVEYVHDSILKVRSAGGAVLLVSSDLDELLRLSDTIVVMFRGNIVDVIPAIDATISRIGRSMLEGVAD